MGDSRFCLIRLSTNRNSVAKSIRSATKAYTGKTERWNGILVGNIGWPCHKSPVMECVSRVKGTSIENRRRSAPVGVCLSSGINRSLFRWRRNWRMLRQHVVSRASLLFECGADIGCRYASRSKYSIDSLVYLLFSSFPFVFAILPPLSSLCSSQLSVFSQTLESLRAFAHTALSFSLRRD